MTVMQDGSNNPTAAEGGTDGGKAAELIPDVVRGDDLRNGKSQSASDSEQGSSRREKGQISAHLLRGALNAIAQGAPDSDYDPFDSSYATSRTSRESSVFEFNSERRVRSGIANSGKRDLRDILDWHVDSSPTEQGFQIPAKLVTTIPEETADFVDGTASASSTDFPSHFSQTSNRRSHAVSVASERPSRSRQPTLTTHTAQSLGRSRAGSLTKQHGISSGLERLTPLPRPHIPIDRSTSASVIRRSKSTPRVSTTQGKGTSYFALGGSSGTLKSEKEHLKQLQKQYQQLQQYQQQQQRQKQQSNAATPPMTASTGVSQPAREGHASREGHSSKEAHASKEGHSSRDHHSPREAPPTTSFSFHDYLYLSLGPTPASKHDLASAEIRIERLTNFLSLPAYLEGALWFGCFACLDGWLWYFTILPMRFIGALWVLVIYWMRWLGEQGANYAKSWLRPESSSAAESRRGSSSEADKSSDNKKQRLASSSGRTSRRRKTSDLLPSHKADLLKGAVVFCSCWVLMSFDASRMYHGIRGQNAIKLYVIFNVLDVTDRLCSALGQDIFECLFSRESLERRPDGTSKIIRPFAFFLLSLVYNVLHSTALFYQVITLNVAVNSYSNALLTLLLSNQFVEIKSTVFKKFEKENLFQMTCADIVERFQLWLMLLIIASRNLVEVGLDGFLGVGGFGLSGLVTSGISLTLGHDNPSTTSNASKASSSGGMILPKSFTIFPKWTGQVMGPFLLVLGSEMLVDWIKHAYISKFNNVKPQIYSRFLDVLAKDYYTNAFVEENLTKRLGLPVIPLSCLFIRASLQTYQMFIATYAPAYPLPSATTSLSEHTSSSPATTAALNRFDRVLRAFSSDTASSSPSGSFLSSHLASTLTMVFFFFAAWLVLLAIKLVLGIALLGFSRRRYKGMKEREKANYDSSGRRVGGWGTVEIDDDRRKWIFMGDKEGERAARERDRAPPKDMAGLPNVTRYAMVAKRIW